MDLIHSIILGVVEGVTEFLPISSTGHLTLTSELLKLEQTEFLKTFEVAIQFGAILSVVVLYWRTLLTNWQAFKRIAAAFVPTIVLGGIFYKVIKNYLIGNNTITLAALFIGGILLILFELKHEEKADSIDKIEDVPLKKSVAIGLFQSIAMIPGVSRSAATILGGLMLNLKRQTIVEFSFLLAVPTMLAATVLDLFQSYKYITAGQLGLLGVGFVVSFIVALLSVKFLLRYIKNHTFIGFGVYRIVLALLFWLVIL